MKMLRLLTFILLFSVLAGFSASAAEFSEAKNGIYFSVPEGYTLVTPDTVKQNSQTVELLGHSADSLKAYMAENDVVLLAVRPQNTAQLQLRVYEIEFSKDLVTLAGLGDTELQAIGQKLADEFTVQTVGGVPYFRTVQNGTGYGTVQYITIKNGQVYRLVYYGTSLAEAEAAIAGLGLSDVQSRFSLSDGMMIFLTVVISLVILLALVAVVLLGISFYKDLKNRYGENNDVREYIRIKRRKF